MAKNAYMGKRIPDITCGLSSYMSSDPYDDGVDGREIRIREILQKRSLNNSIYTVNGPSLIVDGKWGNVPFSSRLPYMKRKRIKIPS